MEIEPYRGRGILPGIGLILAGVGALYLEQAPLGWLCLVLGGLAAGYLGGTDGPDGATTAFYAIAPVVAVIAAAGAGWVLFEFGGDAFSGSIGLVAAVIIVQYGVLASTPILLGGAVGGAIRNRFGPPIGT